MPRLVKRYSNRKLYDTSESRYVTLDEIARWVKAGEEVKIVENESGEDLTAVTFAQIILEEERKKNGYLSLPLLRNLIQHGEAALQNLAATVDRGMEAIRTAPVPVLMNHSPPAVSTRLAWPLRCRPSVGFCQAVSSGLPGSVS